MIVFLIHIFFHILNFLDINYGWSNEVLLTLSASSFPILSFRLFSCGTSKDGDSFLVEWNESEGAIKRTYSGFRKKSAGVVQFDTTQNHFLAVGEDNQIKFWDMDNINILTSTDAEGGLPVSIFFVVVLGNTQLVS